MGDFHFAMVSEWMINGNINEFVKANGDVDRFELVGSPPHPIRHSMLIIPSDSSKMLLTDYSICTVDRWYMGI